MPKQGSAMKKRTVRGSASGRPIMALLDLLGRRWSLRIIWELRDDRSLTSRALRTACDEASPTMLQARLSELREAGFVELVAGDGYRLTGLGKELFENFLPLHRFAERGARLQSAGIDQAAATVRLAPSACTILTRLPAGASGPATRQIVSSIRTVPEPSMIGFSSVNTRPTSASVRLLRNGLLWLTQLLLRATRRHSGTAATAKTANIRSCGLPGRSDRERQQPDQQGGEPEPEHEDTRRQQLQRHQDEAEDQPVPGAKRCKTSRSSCDPLFYLVTDQRHSGSEPLSRLRERVAARVTV